MAKAIGYVRVSSDKQDLEGQRHAILEYAHTHDLHVDLREFVVSSKRGSQDRGIDELIEILDSGDTLLVTELSRLGRNMLGAMTLIEGLVERGVNLIFILQPALSVEGPMRKLMVAVYGFLAETEKEFISMRTKQGLEAARASGKALGRPKGSRSSKLDDRVEEIKALLGKGISQASIAKWMDVSAPAMHYFIRSRGLKK